MRISSDRLRLGSPRAFAAALLTLVGLAVGLAASGRAFPDPDPGGWEEVDRLVGEQKLREALALAGALTDAARAAGEGEGWTRGLVEQVRLRLALGEVEGAVRELSASPWPEGGEADLVLRLFRAEALRQLLQRHGWEIGQREASGDPGRHADLADAVWLSNATTAELTAAARADLLAVWSERAAWGDRPLGALAAYVDQNGYPARIRGTLRDTVTYLGVELFADSALWTPAESASVWRLDLGTLIDPPADPQGGAAAAVAQETAHPLVHLAGLLADLEAWHREARRPEAAFEARRERLARLWAAAESADRPRLRDALQASLDALGRRWRWWSFGMATLADQWRTDVAPGALALARDVARAGAEAHPESLGGRRCGEIAAELETPFYRLESTAADGERRRSLRVTHRNLPQLHFRAWKLDLVRQVEAAPFGHELATPRQVEELLKTQAQVAWSIVLPATPDLREHATYVEPNLAGPGLWVVAASARPDFAERGNQRQAVALVLTDLVVLARADSETPGVGWEATVVDGDLGQPQAGVEVDFFRADWGRAGHRPLATRTTGADGRVRFAPGEGEGRHFLLARRKGDATLAQELPWNHPSEQVPVAALVYTDRSVYRPGQKILWKAVAYRGAGGPGRFATEPDARLQLELRDAHGEAVETLSATTNAYGTASGEVAIPSGRLLGHWGLYVAGRGGASFLVEEYKRPTFEVTLAEPAAALRINRPAELTGTARYLFGLPVAEGRVSWRVTREPVLPPWWPWGGWRGGWIGNESGEPLAAGEAALASDGTFRVAFTPLADERSAASGITYRFRLDADVTDAAGETRSASRSFRLGFVAVETAVEAEAGFVRAGTPARFTLNRRDLDSQPRAGQATWRLLAVAAPGKAVPPADLPLAEPGPFAAPIPKPASSSLPSSSSPSAAPEEPFRTPGDLLRPRWDPGYDPKATMASWPDGPELRRGKLTHGADGAASLELKGLKPGVYRLRYRTVDDFGAEFETATELLVAGPEPLDLPLPALLVAERATVPAGETARWLVGSGLAGQHLELEIHRDFRLAERRVVAGEGMRVVEIPVRPEDRGGFGVAVAGVADHQLLRLEAPVFVPWDDRELDVSFVTFRDRLQPGARETWRVTVRAKGGDALAAGAAEVLASMYDRSLDLFAPYQPPNPLDLYPRRDGVGEVSASLGSAPMLWASAKDFGRVETAESIPDGDALRLYDALGVGGPGWRDLMFKVQGVDTLARAVPVDGDLVVVAAEPSAIAETTTGASMALMDSGSDLEPPPPPAAEIRTDFSETAFWHPHLVTGEDGSVAFEFTVPDAVTEWSVWAHALTRDLAAGSANRRTRTVKELIVRPVLPRFLREGDRAELAVAVQNASDAPLSGRLEFDLLDPESEASRAEEFGLAAARREVTFTVAPGGSETFTFPVTAPRGVGEVAVRAVGRAGEWSDGELRPLPLLPGRAYLSQSRFAALTGRDRRVLSFDHLAAQAGPQADPTLVSDRLVVSVDGQLIYGVLAALPYLVDFPHECTEQTFNRFYTAALVAGVFADHPAVAAVAEKLAAERDTRLPAWEREDPNRRIALEETPWLARSRGRTVGVAGWDLPLIKVLDPQVAAAHRASALAKLEEAQTASGGFPWWPGGPPSPYMTLYLLHGFSRALEAGVEVDRGMVERAWRYLHGYYVDEVARPRGDGACCVETVTFLNYVLSAYPDASWTGGVFSEEDRAAMLARSLARWREHSPFLKGYLALTLHRAGRSDEARQVFAAVMDSARTDPDFGTYWAPEERSWLWYNDTIESHAFALRVLLELAPDDPRRHGLVQWLFLNRQLNHWKSTRATAEALHAVVGYLQREGALGVREEVRVAAGPRREAFVFEPEEYTGGKASLVVPGPDVTPAMAEVTVEKDTPGLAFAGATWHFSTEDPPEEGDREGLFAVSRRYFKRERAPGGSEWRLTPLASGVPVVPGDQVEVQLTVTARHAAEYVHLRDPRPAGFEPETPTSGYRWDLGLVRYEEIRDSATNVFFEQLPAGTYTLKLRLRAAHAGTFNAAPATLQSMYAPEFTAHSGGGEVAVGGRE